MKLIILNKNKEKAIEFKSTKDLAARLCEKDLTSAETYGLKLSFKDSQNHGILRLLVILSPIIIAAFDSSKKELEFFRHNLEKSPYSYGLYPAFFDNFDQKSYFESYKAKEKSEDIILEEDGEILFTINPLKRPYLLALTAMIFSLIINDEEREKLLNYFAEITDRIVINGRRSILSNGIQAFYLNKYVIVRIMEFGKIIKEKSPENYTYYKEILALSEKMKRPGDML